MSRISTKIALTKLTGATVMDITGNSGPVKCLVIPIAMANLYEGAKDVYLDVTSFDLTNPKPDSKDTHLVKQSLSKEKFAAMTDEEKRSQPIIGNSIVWNEGSSNSGQNQQTTAAAKPSWL